ncbi:phosphoribosylanthranilate isomerase [Alteromonadaceae bacterium 2753L.S.0a.02]|nr:phosphoribosylanthranilate isomerase [Alteromonadaceae bacterium 2753L.S.0a.02]
MRVKICGITNIEDARSAVAAGADAIGLVFYAPSPRNIKNLAVARELALEAGPFVTVVALFVNPESGWVNRVLQEVPVHLLQFHGDESPAFCAQFSRPYVKVFRVKEDLDLNRAMADYPGASGFLLDAYKKGVPGGTGESFDWTKVPLNPPKPVVLAGGLSPENVAVAVKMTTPYGVDVSGGVEASPGKKDKHKIHAFINNAKLESLSE